MKLLAATITLILLTSTAFSMTVGKEQFTCPIDGNKFEDYVNYSGTSFGMRLDLKPIGPTPAPWALPICQKCQFPLFKKDFEAEEIERYKVFVDSKEFKGITKDGPPYFLLAKLKEFDKAPDGEIAYSYLQASWEVEGNKKQYSECIRLARLHYERDFTQSKIEDDESLTSGVMVAELSRQLGDFKKAIKQVELLKQRNIENETIAKVLDQILKLSKDSNLEPQEIE